jgi:hypothetical protein
VVRFDLFPDDFLGIVGMLYVISILIENGRFMREALWGVLMDGSERRGWGAYGDEERLGFCGRGGRQLRGPSTSVWKTSPHLFE